MNFLRLRRAVWILGALAASSLAFAQGNQLTVAPPQKVMVKRGGNADVKLDVRIQNGYHVNSDKPTEEYLIPLRLRWEPGPLVAGEIVYPKPEMQTYSFSDKPLSVFTGNFPIVIHFKAEAGAAPASGVQVGKLRYQACSHDTCYRPATVEIRLPYEIQ